MYSRATSNLILKTLLAVYPGAISPPSILLFGWNVISPLDRLGVLTPPFKVVLQVVIWGCGWTEKQETWEKEGGLYLGGEIEAREPDQTWQG